MTTVSTLIVLLISYILETTLLSSISFFGASPKLVLVIIICYSMVSGKEKGAIIGIISGFFVDIFSSGAFGINILLYTYSAAIAGALSDKVFGKNAITSVVITFIVSFIYGIIFALAMYILKIDRNIIYFIFAYFLPMSVYNALLSFFVYLLIENINTLSYRRS